MRVPDDLLGCVCFICVKVRRNGRDQFQFGGTGFFVGVPSEALPEEITHIYLVTAKHNVEKARALGKLFLRMNTASGGARFVEVDAPWHYPEAEASDIAVLPWAPPIEKFEYRWIHRNMFAADEVVREQGIGIGDELVITGLFTQRFGAQRNLPIVRTGIIAGMPDEPLIDDNSGLPYDAYLAEVRSIGGLSGSPTFAVLGPGRAHKGKVEMSRKTFLLGVVRGHWDYRFRDAPADFVGDELEAVNMGIAIISPIQDALAIIDSGELVKMRRRAAQQRLEQRSVSKDT